MPFVMALPSISLKIMCFAFNLMHDWGAMDSSCLILIRQKPDRSACRLILIWHGPDQAVPNFEIWFIPAVKLVVFR